MADGDPLPADKRPAKLRIGYLPAVCQSWVVLRPLELLERELGLPVEWVQYSAGPALVQAFAQGQVDAGFLGIPPTLIGVDKGVPIRAVASTHAEGSALVGRAADQYRTFDELGDVTEVVQQLRGKVLGVPAKGSIEDSILRDILRTAGLDPERDVTIKNVQAAPSLPDMLAQGEVDAMIVWPPFGTKAVAAGSGQVLINARDLWANSPCCVLAVTQDLIDEYPEFVQALVLLHARTSTFMMAYPDKTAQIAADSLGLPFQTIRQSLSDNPRYSALPDEGYLSATDRFAASLKQSGYIEHDLKWGDVFDLRFISHLGMEMEAGVGMVPPDPSLYEYIIGERP
ncbi:MAG: ABC transporter substrate-binding protein [Thermoleophilia bacterium]|nr:ABC transporter substrate-binding protein [Thermoleophilia bacterium]